MYLLFDFVLANKLNIYLYEWVLSKTQEGILFELDSFDCANNFYTTSATLLVTKSIATPTLDQVLKTANLHLDYSRFLELTKKADQSFKEKSYRDAFNYLYKIWYDDSIVPALLLRECFYARELVYPEWTNKKPFNAILVPKKPQPNRGYNSSPNRILIVPKLNTRICMGTVNTILQSSCGSWSNRTTGFRPNFGTHIALHLLSEQATQCLNKHKQVYIVSFDIQSAYNNVLIKDLFNVLKLKNLPHPMKSLIWQWQCTKLNGPFKQQGLAQGFSYSPTLFAWYLDQAFIKNTSFVCYADNMAIALPFLTDIDTILNNAETTLNNMGLSINKSTLAVHFCKPDVQLEFKWLGHTLTLPLCNVTLNDSTTLDIKKPHKTISLEQWDQQLRQMNWVANVKNKIWTNL